MTQFRPVRGVTGERTLRVTLSRVSRNRLDSFADPALSRAKKAVAVSAEAPRHTPCSFDIAWALADHHLNGLTDEQCRWRPLAQGLHVHAQGEIWKADWPEHEGYDFGPPSIAWTTWHIVW